MNGIESIGNRFSEKLNEWVRIYSVCGSVYGICMGDVYICSLSQTDDPVIEMVDKPLAEKIIEQLKLHGRCVELEGGRVHVWY